MSEGRRPRLLVVLGPTGTGKTELGVALAERLDGEIVGCDAVQAYRGLDAATAKPGPEHQARIPHHLVDFVDPGTDLNMADYVQAADSAIAAIARRGRTPLIVGGTGMYLRGLLRGVLPAGSRRPELRTRLRRIVDRGGLGRLHRWLTRLDPESARRLAPEDAQRTVRAIELALSTRGGWSRSLRESGTWSAPEERYPNVKIGLDMAGPDLAPRLNARVERFFRAGLVNEVQALLQSGVPRSANAFKAIGYREVLDALDEGQDPFGTVETIQGKTRRYAKRQRTWFRRERDVTWLDAGLPIGELVGASLNVWRSTR